MNKYLGIAVLFLTMSPAMPAMAEMDKPPDIGAHIYAKKPYGEGTFTYMLITAYDASLWTDASTWSFNAPFALALRYARSFKGEDIAQRSIEEMQHIDELSDEEAEDYKTQLEAIFPDVNEGDVIDALYIPKYGIRFNYNGKFIGELTDIDFAQRFLSIWLSDRTSAPDLRRKLLHLTDHKD